MVCEGFANRFFQVCESDFPGLRACRRVLFNVCSLIPDGKVDNMLIMCTVGSDLAPGGAFGKVWGEESGCVLLGCYAGLATIMDFACRVGRVLWGPRPSRGQSGSKCKKNLL